MKYSFFKLFILFLFVFIPLLLFALYASAQKETGSIKFGDFYPPTITNTLASTKIPTPTTPPEEKRENQIPLPTSLPTRLSPTPTPLKTQLVIQMVQALQKTCRPNGVVSSKNYRCLYSLVPSLPRLVLEELQISAVYINWLQCVGFVRAAILLSTGITLPRPGPGTAIGYASNIPSPYQFMRNNGKNSLRIEDIAIWDYADSVGHIAYVVKVYNQRDFQVAEANYRAAGRAGLRNTTLSSPELIGWLRKK